MLSNFSSHERAVFHLTKEHVHVCRCIGGLPPCPATDGRPDDLRAKVCFYLDESILVFFFKRDIAGVLRTCVYTRNTKQGGGRERSVYYLNIRTYSCCTDTVCLEF